MRFPCPISFFELINQPPVVNMKSSACKEASMSKSGTLIKARILEVVVEPNGYIQKKNFETVDTVLDLIKRSLESGAQIMISS